MVALLKFPPSVISSPAAGLRALADRVDAGEFSDELRVVTLVITSDKDPAIFVWGEMAGHSQTFEDLHYGAHILMQMRSKPRE